MPSSIDPRPTPSGDPNLLPNGVRYGDHHPNLPSRIVRVASPDVKLDAEVYEVYAIKGEWEVAEYAAGHHYNTLNPGEGGNIVLNGHNNWKGEVFRYLEFLKVGDLIQVWTLDGKEHRYRVSQTMKLKEAGATMEQRIQNGRVMLPTDHEQLTLITCWPYTTYTHRLVIIALPEE
jgi:sortase A